MMVIVLLVYIDLSKTFGLFCLVSGYVNPVVNQYLSRPLDSSRPGSVKRSLHLFDCSRSICLRRSVALHGLQLQRGLERFARKISLRPQPSRQDVIQASHFGCNESCLSPDLVQDPNKVRHKIFGKYSNNIKLSNTSLKTAKIMVLGIRR